MTFAQRRNRLTTHFSERIPVVKRRMTVLVSEADVNRWPRNVCEDLASHKRRMTSHSQVQHSGRLVKCQHL